MFQQGAFAVNIKGKPWHSVAVDEAHEMMMNKSCKTSIVKPHRISALENITNQLFPENTTTEIKSPFSSVPIDKKHQLNVQVQIRCIEQHSLLSLERNQLIINNPFSNVAATSEQSNDLLNFRTVGQINFLLRISAVILKEPSVQAPQRRLNIQTFSERKKTSRKISQLEKDKKLILSAMKMKISYSQRTGKPISNVTEQLIELPLALCDNDGIPLKGQKSYTTKNLQTRYQKASPPIISNDLSYVPQCTIIEGMFIINTAPLKVHRTLHDYCHFLIYRYIITEFKKGTNEVHLIFDNAGSNIITPKSIEQQRIIPVYNQET
jgi:hypothetical protein